ncbi:MAG: energy-coupling factor transporter transmembrane protein EcfT [Thermotogae bacterium]|nr:energy-coupling factor transporter transmembrane protein EcfT [Thermotogota bacterium]
MIKNIVLGRYISKISFVHSLDPRTKILSSFVFILAIFFVNSFWGYVLLALILISFIFLSSISLLKYLESLKALWLLIILAFIFQLFSSNGRVVLNLWIMKITSDGVYNAVFISLRLIFILEMGAVLTFTTSPTQITDGLESIFSPLKKLGFPSQEMAMMLSISLRFIPILADETDRIMKAQASRGARFDTGGIIKRVKSFIPIIIPLLSSAIRHAQALAIAMESRCYRGGTGRTKFHILRYRICDYLTYSIFMVSFICIVISRRL